MSCVHRHMGHMMDATTGGMGRNGISSRLHTSLEGWTEWAEAIQLLKRQHTAVASKNRIIGPTLFPFLVLNLSPS
jgi:hypothetical protein